MAEMAFRNIGNGFELTVEGGEILALVGASGSGKSRALRMAAGVEKVTSGDIALDGATISGLSPKKRDVSLVSPDAPMKASLTVYKAMALDAKRLGKGDVDGRVRAAAEKLGVSPILDRKLRDVSESERRLAALGRAIAAEPKAYLLDDVCAGMDAGLKARVMGVIRGLKGIVLYATCSMDDALLLGGRVAVVDGGRVVQTAPGYETVEKPGCTAAAKACGVNLVTAKLTPRDSRMYAVIGDTSLRVPDLAVKKLKSDIYIGKDVILGLRPDAISADEEFIAENFGTVFTATVEESVFLGGSARLGLRLAGADSVICAALPTGAPISVGTELKVAADPARLLMFDAATGENILF